MKINNTPAYNLFREDTLGNEYHLRVIEGDEDNVKATAERAVVVLEALGKWPKDHTPVLRGYNNPKDAFYLDENLIWVEI
tara:strand:+ start:2388 stop:2627 length:240 start_codon:yes stop_codon:yes gene_type:complete